MSDSERFAVRLSETAESRARFLADRGPYMTRTGVYRAAIRAAWYSQAGAAGHTESRGEVLGKKASFRVTSQLRARLDALCGDDGPFANGSAAVRYGLDRVWEREMDHEPSAAVRRGE